MTRVAAGVFAALVLSCPTTALPAETLAEAACAVTYPDGGVQGNDTLGAVFPPGSRIVFRPGGPGFVDADGAMLMSFAWVRHKPGQLTIRGRRLDAPAEPLRAYISDGYGEVGGQDSFLVFPTPGCWEVTGSMLSTNFTFVIVVDKIGEGTDGQWPGLEKGWRVTGS